MPVRRPLDDAFPIAGAAVLRCLIPVLLGIAALPAESRLEFVDLRLQGGLTESRGFGGAVTLMCGNIGTKGTGDEEPDDLGIVLGVRAGARRLKADNGEEVLSANEAFIGAVGGIGYYLNKREHMELCVGYAVGRVTLPDDHGGFSATDGDSSTWSGELGWYHTWKRGWQFGLLGGWSATRMACRQDTPGEFTAAAYGVDLAASVGFRF